MKVAKTTILGKNTKPEQFARQVDADLTKLFVCLSGRVRFGTGTDGDRGENISGEFQVISDTGSADTEITLAHGVGAVPIGFIVLKIDKGGVVYDSGTSWTSTNIYLKCSAANCAVTLFLLK